MSTVLVVENEINIRYSSMYIKYHKAQQERDFQTNLEYQFVNTQDSPTIFTFQNNFFLINNFNDGFYILPDSYTSQIRTLENSSNKIW